MCGPTSTTSDHEETLAQPLLRDDTTTASSASSAPSAASPSSSSKRNVRLILLYTLLMFGGRSMWSQTVLSAYVYLNRNNDPEAVGLLTAIMGICQLVFSFPSGYLADRFRRDRMLKCSSVVGIVAIATTVVSLKRESYQLLAISLALWGGFWGIAYTCVSALFADSIKDGDRSLWFTRRMILIKVGNMTGPIVVMFMFAYLGDTWSVDECSFVMSCGQVLCAMPTILLCFLRDQDNDDTEENEDYQNDEEPNTDNDEEIQQESGRSCLFCTRRYIPAMVATADILSGIAAGMSIRYFPIFFLDNMNLRPVTVQILFTLSVLCQIPISIIAQRGSKCIGRCQVTVVFKWLGIAFFVAMIITYKMNLPAILICILWIGRTSAMNGTSALTKSIIMDEVPKRKRAKWSALESVNMFSWSGSAALGGFLVKEEGIIFNFCVTSALQLLATVPLLLLFGKVRQEGARPIALQFESETSRESTEAEDPQHVSSKQ